LDEVITVRILRARLDAALAGDIDSKQVWERSLYDQLAGSAASRIVLYGAGNNGRALLRGLRSLGVEPLAFSDGNPRLWGTEVDGLSVLAPEEAARAYGDNSAFVVTIFSPGAEKAFPAVRNRLVSVGCARVLPFSTLACKYKGAFLPNYYVDLPHKVLCEGDLVREAYDLWADDESREEYVAQIEWRTSLDYDVLGPPRQDVPYFPERLFARNNDEVFVDCGAFDGDTIRSFLEWSGGEFARIWAFEPDPGNFRTLSAFVEGLPPAIRTRIELIAAGVGRKSESLRFKSDGTSSSAVAEDGAIEIETRAVDGIDFGSPPTFVKMDIEAFEPEALEGAAATIARHAPVLAVCVYHRQDHLWRIPLQISRLNSSYKFFLRKYMTECWETVCLAVPPHRLLT
jgi:FkbM family methyltransferase